MQDWLVVLWSTLETIKSLNTKILSIIKDAVEDVQKTLVL